MTVVEYARGTRRDTSWWEACAKPTVIVVDDDADTRGALDMLFRDEGYTVATAHSGVRALEMLRQCRDHAVVLFDYLMPEGNGLYLLQAVAQEEALQRRYTYLCMAACERSRMPTEFTGLMGRLAVPFVAKPFDVDTLLMAVDEVQRRLMVQMPSR